MVNYNTELGTKKKDITGHLIVIVQAFQGHRRHQIFFFTHKKSCFDQPRGVVHFIIFLGVALESDLDQVHLQHVDRSVKGAFVQRQKASL